jgi:hypothetical protein
VERQKSATISAFYMFYWIGKSANSEYDYGITQKTNGSFCMIVGYDGYNILQKIKIPRT